MLISGRELVEKLRSEVKECDCGQVLDAVQEGAVVIDIREPAEYAGGVIPGAALIPRGVLEMNLTAHPAVANQPDPMAALADQPVYLVCRSGARTVLAAHSLQQMGLTQVYSMHGGMMAWQNLQLPTVKP